MRNFNYLRRAAHLWGVFWVSYAPNCVWCALGECLHPSRPLWHFHMLTTAATHAKFLRCMFIPPWVCEPRADVQHVFPMVWGMFSQEHVQGRLVKHFPQSCPFVLPYTRIQELWAVWNRMREMKSAPWVDAGGSYLGRCKGKLLVSSNGAIRQ